MKTKLIALFSLLFVFGVIMMSCDELDLLPDPEETSTQSAEDNAAAELAVANVFEGVNSYGIDEDGKKSMNGEGPAVTWDGNTVSLDYTDVPGSGGTIVAAFDGAATYGNVGLSALVTVTDFVIDGTTMNGSFTLTLTQILDIINSQGPAFNITIINELTFTVDTITTTWTGVRNIVWVEGFFSLDDFADDAFEISGSSSGVNAEGVAYSVVISDENPLLMNSCEWISQGEITITEGDTEMILDFGEGDCDNLLSVTIDGLTVEIEM